MLLNLSLREVLALQELRYPPTPTDSDALDSLFHKVTRLRNPPPKEPLRGQLDIYGRQA